MSTNLYAWGANSHGQLGLGYASEMCTTPQLVVVPPALGSIHQISGGGGHCLFLNDRRQLFACGWNNKGQLGIGKSCDFVPNITEILPAFVEHSTIEQIECGWDCSAAIGCDGSIFVWGSNLYQQLGISISDTNKCITAPFRIRLPNNEPCVGMKFGLRIACFVTEKYFYFIGTGTKKIFSDTVAAAAARTTIEWQGVRYERIERERCAKRADNAIVCGQKHVMFIGGGGQLTAFGDNKFGQCNVDGIAAEEIRVMRAGWTHNGILNERGEVWLWGRNHYGQIGVNADDADKRIIAKPCRLNLSGNEAEQLHLGAEHGLVVLRSGDGEVMTWGWNEHGNCGNNSEENVYSPTRIRLPGKCLLAATGAGFCFVVVAISDKVD